MILFKQVVPDGNDIRCNILFAKVFLEESIGVGQVIPLKILLDHDLLFGVLGIDVGRVYGQGSGADFAFLLID